MFMIFFLIFNLSAKNAHAGKVIPTSSLKTIGELFKDTNSMTVQRADGSELGLLIDTTPNEYDISFAEAAKKKTIFLRTFRMQEDSRPNPQGALQRVTHTVISKYQPKCTIALNASPTSRESVNSGHATLMCEGTFEADGQAIEIDDTAHFKEFRDGALVFSITGSRNDRGHEIIVTPNVPTERMALPSHDNQEVFVDTYSNLLVDQ